MLKINKSIILLVLLVLLVLLLFINKYSQRGKIF